jgi:hypothetical protein
MSAQPLIVRDLPIAPAVTGAVVVARTDIPEWLRG